MGVFLRDPQQMLYMNPAFLRIFGIDPELSPRTVPDIMSMIHPADLELAADVTNGVDEGVRTQAELRLVRSDGEIRWIRATNDPVAREAGVTTRVAGTIEDITDRKNIELLLRESEERFLQLATHVSVGFNLYEISPPRLRYSNPAFSKIFAFDPEGGPPEPADSFARVHPDDQAVALAGRVRLGEGHVVEYDVRIIRPNGQMRWIHSTMNPIQDDSGVVVRAACLFEDITDRKKSEDAVLESDLRFRQLAGSLEVGISLRQI